MEKLDLAEYLREEERSVDAALDRALQRLSERLPPELLEVARHGIMTGGKRLRPILCVAAWRACVMNGAPEGEAVEREGHGIEIYDLAASLEMIHAYSLMHDDLPCMDDAELRRGKPTPHRIFGEERTTRAGAALIPCAALQAWDAAGALGCADEIRREVVRELARAAGAGGMVGGQALDLLGEGKKLTPVELDQLHERKTGALLVASLRIGAITGGASPAVLAGLDRYGRKIGLAFQIVDDILDATASATELGKNPSDSEMDKSTYVALYGLEEAIRRSRICTTEAKLALEDVGVRAPPLLALADFIVDRER